MEEYRAWSESGGCKEYEAYENYDNYAVEEEYEDYDEYIAGNGKG